MRIGVAADHAGKELKQLVVEMLKLTENEILDFGVSAESRTSVDYPDYAALVASEVSMGKLDAGVLICGTGIGMSITANKFPGVRAAVVWDEFSTRAARQHNNVNILCLGARTTNHMRATEFVKLWLELPFEGSRHSVRVNKIREIEQKLRATTK
ncbi:MAG: ribose 5-phosphate isomerase B [Proteobacteria bacterium]|nr:ribose 5-phosphate isomerase B [Pseudomonadota bacterium]